MAGKVAIRQAKLREVLIDVAEAQIASGGLATLKARPVAEAAGCSLGAIYNIFDDLDALVMAVNGRTFRRLGRFVSDAVQGADARDPSAQLVTMSHGYLHFASDHTHLWRALFDLEMSVEGPVPQWYLEELGAVFGLIAAPLAQLFPDLERAELDLMVRGLFSSVHGIVLLGLEQRISAVPLDQVERMLSQIIGQIGNK
jgi:AcrR family transcriptional regulator